MLFKRHILDLISTGEVDLAFRQWKRPTVKVGGTLITRVGQLQILDISSVPLAEITEEEAKRAGFTSKKALLSTLDPQQVNTNKVQFKLIGADPRTALRESVIWSDEELNGVLTKFNKWDNSSNAGPWTRQTLQLIRNYPGTVSTELAERMNVDRAWLKAQIRKLKAMGLTISLDVGYELSPRGRALMDKL